MSLNVAAALRNFSPTVLHFRARKGWGRGGCEELLPAGPAEQCLLLWPDCLGPFRGAGNLVLAGVAKQEQQLLQSLPGFLPLTLLVGLRAEE